MASLEGGRFTETHGCEKGRPTGRPSHTSQLPSAVQAEKLLPHPQPPVAFGFLNVNPDPCIDVT